MASAENVTLQPRFAFGVTASDTLRVTFGLLPAFELVVIEPTSAETVISTIILWTRHAHVRSALNIETHRRSQLKDEKTVP